MSTRRPQLIWLLALAVGVMPCVGPARAMLTEIAVGGTLLLQTLAVVTELLPQINELTRNLTTLYKSGNELADTVQKIFKPQPSKGGKKSGPAKAAKPAAKKPADDIEVPVIKARAEEPPAEEAAPPSGDEPAMPTSIGDQVRALGETYLKQVSLLQGMKQPEEGAARDAVRAGFEELERRSQSLTETIGERLIHAFEKNEMPVVDEFLEQVRTMNEASRGAIVPALMRFMNKMRFLVLDDPSIKERREFTELDQLYREIRKK